VPVPSPLSPPSLAHVALPVHAALPAPSHHGRGSLPLGFSPRGALYPRNVAAHHDHREALTGQPNAGADPQVFGLCDWVIYFCCLQPQKSH